MDKIPIFDIHGTKFAILSNAKRRGIYRPKNQIQFFTSGPWLRALASVRRPPSFSRSSPPEAPATTISDFVGKSLQSSIAKHSFYSTVFDLFPLRFFTALYTTLCCFLFEQLPFLFKHLPRSTECHSSNDNKRPFVASNLKITNSLIFLTNKLLFTLYYLYGHS